MKPYKNIIKLRIAQNKNQLKIYQLYNISLDII